MYKRPDLYYSTKQLWEIWDEKLLGHKDRLALQIKENSIWHKMTYEELWENQLYITNFLASKYPEAKRVAILSESRPGWAVCFFGILRGPAVIVPLDIQLTTYELCHICEHGEIDVILTSNKFLDKAKEISKKASRSISVENFQRILTDDKEFIPISPKSFGDLSDLALISYTSGTTGATKGVMLSYRNIFYQVNAVEAKNIGKSNDRFLSILPMNHMFELSIGLLAPLSLGASISYISSLMPHEVMGAMKDKKISVMLTVPLFLKSLKRAIEIEIDKTSHAKKIVLSSAQTLASFVKELEDKRKVLFPLHKKFGGNLSSFVSGGAPLDPEIGSFFNNIGFNVLQGYGLTETSPVISTNSLDENKLGSVGRVLDGLEIMIETENNSNREGEILVRSASNMMGYFKNEELTESVFTKDGYFRTGDIGYVDDEGYLFITGRKKNLIVLGGGKKVHPEEVIMILEQVEEVEEAAVYGINNDNGSEEIIAIIKLFDHIKGEKELTKAKTNIDKNCEKLASYKNPHRFIFVSEEFPKGTTRKVKIKELKKIIEEKYLENE